MTRQRKTTVEAAQVEEPELPEPTKAETESALTVHSRFDERRRLARIKLKSHDDGSFSFGPPHSSAAIWAIQVADAMGTGSVAFGQQQVHHLVRIALAEPAKAESVANSMLAMVQCVDAEDEMVAQLAVQMAATHQTAMQALGRAAQAKEVDAIDALGNLANKLMRTYTMQAEALAKMRRGGEQKVKVEHVHVYEGGQAIVGNVTHPPGGERKTKADPMHPRSREPSHLRLSRRCCARTRKGMACQSPAVSGKMRCRMHGGAKGSGGPRGERNGSYRTGLHTGEMVAFRRVCRATIAGARGALDGLA